MVTLNVVLFLGPPDLVNTLFDMIATLKTFRAIGLMGSTALPTALLQFYQDLALITLDFEFSQPGCGGVGGDSSSFAHIYWWNLLLLAATASPVLLVMPMLMLFYYLKGRLMPVITKQSSDHEEGVMDPLQWMTLKWKNRFIFAMLHWACFGTMILTSLSLTAVNCVPSVTGDDYVLRADSAIVCGMGFVWGHASAMFICLGITVVFPLFLGLKIRMILRDELWNDDDYSFKYGNVCQVFKPTCAYFFIASHMFNDVFLTALSVFLVVDQLIMDIIAISGLVVFAALNMYLRPFDARIDFYLQLVGLAVSVGAVTLSQTVAILTVKGETPGIFTKGLLWALLVVMALLASFTLWPAVLFFRDLLLEQLQLLLAKAAPNGRLNMALHQLIDRLGAEEEVDEDGDEHGVTNLIEDEAGVIKPATSTLKHEKPLFFGTRVGRRRPPSEGSSPASPSSAGGSEAGVTKPATSTLEKTRKRRATLMFGTRFERRRAPREGGSPASPSSAGGSERVCGSQRRGTSVCDQGSAVAPPGSQASSFWPESPALHTNCDISDSPGQTPTAHATADEAVSSGLADLISEFVVEYDDEVEKTVSFTWI